MKSEKRRLFIPLFLVVLALVAAVDFWLGHSKVLQNLPTATLLRGEAYNATQAYRSESVAPNVVLLGSSLVTAPVMQGEALAVNKPLERMTYRKCTLLEQMLSGRSNSRPSVFCLAVGGEMASDAYLMAHHLFTPTRKPAVVVWGVGPRDFQDNLMPGADTSETFQVLAGVEDLPQFLNSNQTVDRKVSAALGRVSALWRHHNDLRIYLTLRSKKLMERTLPYVVFEKYGETPELKPRKRGQFPEEALGTPRAFPGIALDHHSPEQTKNEYFYRYNPSSPAQFSEQARFFRLTLDYCKLLNIPVLVLNMPLSQENLSIMPAGSYAAYTSEVSKLCQASGARYVDLNKAPWNEQENFVDTVHLVPEVSTAFLKEIAGVMEKDPMITASLNSRQGVMLSQRGAQ